MLDELITNLDAASAVPRHLAALVEIGRLRGEASADFTARQGLQTHPVLRHPKHKALAPHGPMLVTHTGGARALTEELSDCNSDTVSAWIIGTLPAGRMAEYLSNFTVARASHVDSYLLRFYAPEILPTLHELAPRNWVHLLMKPVVRWCYPQASPQGEGWQSFAGGGEVPGEEYFHGLRYLRLADSPELMTALAGDPQPYRLVNALQNEAPELFDSDCYGVRLAQVEDLLAEARGHGLQREEDLLACVWCLLAEPAIRQEQAWQQALLCCARDGTPLTESYLQ
ncbi:MAG: DUF4123 domain-containing protein [Zoogloeaceae bacterium]|jgi:hypothetical protein|nr:DUF4123 domain-containing protein [Zoogloeaceae bacterium]